MMASSANPAAALHHGPQHHNTQQQPPPAYIGVHDNSNGVNTTHNGNNNNNSNNNVPLQMPARHWYNMTRTIAHYERLEQIGEGTYGQVYKARCKDTGQIVALKKIRVHHGKDWGMPPTVIREIKILKRLQHQNLVRLMEVVSSKGVEYLDEEDESTDVRFQKKSKDRVVDAREGYKGNLFLVLEYVSHDLTGLLDVAYKFSPVQIKCIFRQLLEALQYMHQNKYVHRDIKSSNILLDHHLRLKLADFGLSRNIEPPILDNLHDRASSQEFTNKVITLWYRPPEILMGATRYGPPVDVWSAGCILAELLLGKPLFTGKTEMDQLTLIFELLGTPSPGSWEGLNDLKLLRTGQVTIPPDDKRKLPKLRNKYGKKMSPPALNLLEKLVELDPAKRLTASRALDSRYFLSDPIAPERPEDLEPIQVNDHFHEFQTKKTRRAAKAEAEKARENAKSAGMNDEQAQEQFDTCYKKLMKKVASEGIGAFGLSTRDRKDKAKDRKDRSKSDMASSSGPARDGGDDDRRHKDGRKRRRDHDETGEDRRHASSKEPRLEIEENGQDKKEPGSSRKDRSSRDRRRSSRDRGEKDKEGRSSRDLSHRDSRSSRDHRDREHHRKRREEHDKRRRREGSVDEEGEKDRRRKEKPLEDDSERDRRHKEKALVEEGSDRDRRHKEKAIEEERDSDRRRKEKATEEERDRDRRRKEKGGEEGEEMDLSATDRGADYDPIDQREKDRKHRKRHERDRGSRERETLKDADIRPGETADVYGERSKRGKEDEGRAAGAEEGEEVPNGGDKNDPSFSRRDKFSHERRRSSDRDHKEGSRRKDRRRDREGSRDRSRHRDPDRGRGDHRRNMNMPPPGPDWQGRGPPPMDFPPRGGSGGGRGPHPMDMPPGGRRGSGPPRGGPDGPFGPPGDFRGGGDAGHYGPSVGGPGGPPFRRDGPRGDRDGPRGRGDRPGDRPDRGDRPGDRPDRSDRPGDRSDRPDRGDRPGDRPDRGGGDRPGNRPGRGDRPPDWNDRSDRGGDRRRGDNHRRSREKDRR